MDTFKPQIAMMFVGIFSGLSGLAIAWISIKKLLILWKRREQQ